MMAKIGASLDNFTAYRDSPPPGFKMIARKKPAPENGSR
jgi:hypothetical protein